MLLLQSYYCVIHLKYVYFNFILNIYIIYLLVFLNAFYNTKSKIYLYTYSLLFVNKCFTRFYIYIYKNKASLFHQK